MKVRFLIHYVAYPDLQKERGEPLLLENLAHVFDVDVFAEYATVRLVGVERPTVPLNLSDVILAHALRRWDHLDRLHRQVQTASSVEDDGDPMKVLFDQQSGDLTLRVTANRQRVEAYVLGGRRPIPTMVFGFQQTILHTGTIDLDRPFQLPLGIHWHTQVNN